MVRYTMVLLSGKRLTPKALLLLASIALRRLDFAPSAPMTNNDSSTHSFWACGAAAAAVLLPLLLLALVVWGWRWKVS
jgi:hypothetical protein